MPKLQSAYDIAVYKVHMTETLTDVLQSGGPQVAQLQS